MGEGDKFNAAASDVFIDESGSWKNLGLDARIQQAIDHLGFEKPTLIQSSAIPLALQEKRDIIAKASTGSGKTAAYVIPLIQSLLSDDLNEHKTRGVILVPTRELANQVVQFLEQLLVFCNNKVSLINLSANFNDQVINSLLINKPDIIVSTPAKLIGCLEKNAKSDLLSLSEIKYLVIDEVDLVLSYGYMDDLERLEHYMPLKKNHQTFMMSATINDDLNDLKSRFCSKPAILKLDDEGLKQNKLLQFYARTTEFDKFLLAYVIFKLNLIKGKTIVFVNNIDRGYRLKLFLEQFGIRSCILNSELPVNSRLHIVDQFNKNVYNLLIATDETNDFTTEKDEAEEEDAEANEDGKVEGAQKDTGKKNKSKEKKDKEYGVSRGVDFKNVACVLNFDFPSTSRAYVHRIGRTARAGKSGMALSFIIPKKEFGKHKIASSKSAKKDEKVLSRIVKQQSKNGFEIKPYQFDMRQVESFRYRSEDAFRAVTQVAIREARLKEIKSELMNSEKLKRFFEENPQDLATLRHDREIHPTRVQAHLKRVPDYLLPESARSNIKKIGFVPFHKKKHNGKGKKKSGVRKSDPLKSFAQRR